MMTITTPTDYKELILTGMQPTGNIHLGNYIGALRPLQLILQQTDATGIVFIADLHSLTSSLDSLKRVMYTVRMGQIYRALLPKDTVIFKQSDIGGIVTEISWIISCQASVSSMLRGHACKSRVVSASSEERDIPKYLNFSMGVLTYPMLMAADILALYPHKVLVGRDQTQHIEYCRDLSKKVNTALGSNILSKPEFITTDVQMPGLDGRKMGKSYLNTIELLDTPDVVRTKIMRMQTDSSDVHAVKDTSTCHIFNMMNTLASYPPATLSSEFSNHFSIKKLKSMYLVGTGWSVIKEYAAVGINLYLRDLRLDHVYSDDIDSVTDVLLRGKSVATARAQTCLDRLKRSLGLTLS